MEMDALWNTMLTAIVGLIVWWIKFQSDEAKRVQILLNRTREEIARDKQQHFIAGFALALIVGSLFGPLIGLGAALVAGIAKELYDLTGRGTPEWADLWFTIAGGLIGSLITYGV